MKNIRKLASLQWLYTFCDGAYARHKYRDGLDQSRG